MLQDNDRQNDFIRQEVSDYDKCLKLFEMYSVSMLRRARKIMRHKEWAEDAVQSSFLKLYRHMDKIDDVNSAAARCYLSAILENTCYDLLKTNKKYCLMDEEEMENDVRFDFYHADDTMDVYMCKEILDIVRAIPDIYADILILNGVYQHSTQEIAELLEISQDTVRKRLERGRKKVYEVLEDQLG